jgi:hypothetical protein
MTPLKDFKAGLQQALEFRIAGGRNQCRLERAIDCLMIRYLIGHISLVECAETAALHSLVLSIGLANFKTDEPQEGGNKVADDAAGGKSWLIIFRRVEPNNRCGADAGKTRRLLRSGSNVWSPPLCRTCTASCFGRRCAS